MTSMKATGLPASLWPLPKWKRRVGKDVTDLKKSKLINEFLGLQVHVEKLQSQLDAQPGHPLRLEDMLKEWALAFYRIGIAIRFTPSTDPFVRFTKHDVEVAIHYSHIMSYGMFMIVSMFNQVPNTCVPPRHFIEGTDVGEDWKPPEPEEDD
jgi:hypothetical protein